MSEQDLGGNIWSDYCLLHMENNSNINKDIQNNAHDSQSEQINSPQDTGMSLKFRLILFFQVILTAICYLYIWYSPGVRGTGGISSSLNPPAIYPAILAFILVFIAFLSFVLPTFTKKMFFTGAFFSSILQSIVTLVFFLFLCIFILTTLNVTGSFARIPLIDPIPFLKWAKFLI